MNMISTDMEDLFKRFWDWRLREFPEFATLIGEHAFDDKLQSYTLESIENRRVAVGDFLAEASELLLTPDLKKEEKVDLAYFINDLNTYVRGQTAKGYFFPLCYLFGVQVEFERILNSMKKESEADFLKILKRLSLLPNQVSEIIAIMREGIKNQMTFHLISISGVGKQLDKLQKQPEETVFYKPFTAIPEDALFSTISRSELLTKAKSIIAETILPAFKNLKNFLEKEYSKHLRPDIAITSINAGKEFYQMCLDYHLSCTMTPEEVYETGLKEVERIKQKIEMVIESLELKMSLKEFSDHIRRQKDFNFQNVEELLETYRGAIFNQIEPKLLQYFKFLPKCKPVIELAPSSGIGFGAYYYAGNLDGSRPGIFFINASDLNESPKYEVISLALHETIPGHHLQVYYLLENENVAEFRRITEFRRLTEAPSLFPIHAAFSEGWGLYSEHLGYELGLYDDVYLEYGHLSYEMLRACRLVVDTGIHAFGWTYEQAVDYILEHTAFHRNNVENEINRYITWPGQACAYKVGELKIKALREKAENALGTKFDIREFHDVVLQSYGTLHGLEQRISDYIFSAIKCIL